jgi:hypothetical protein
MLESNVFPLLLNLFFLNISRTNVAWCARLQMSFFSSGSSLSSCEELMWHVVVDWNVIGFRVWNINIKGWKILAKNLNGLNGWWWLNYSFDADLVCAICLQPPFLSNDLTLCLWWLQRVIWILATYQTTKLVGLVVWHEHVSFSSRLVWPMSLST